MTTTSDKIKKLKKKCDELWSKAVRTRDGACILCGNTNGLAAHHWIHSRAQGNRHRWNILNGVTLCYACHIHKVHKHASAEIIDELKEMAFDRGILTPAEYDAIKFDHVITKMGVDDMKNVLDYLTAYLEQLNNYKIGCTD